MSKLISLKCKNCGEELALVKVEKFEIISSIENIDYSEALGWYYIGYCEDCFSLRDTSNKYYES